MRVRYVGATQRPLARRLSAHLSRAMHESTPKALWLQELRKLRLAPIPELLEDAEDDNWEAREQFWIEVLSPGLLNQTAGGVGAGGMPESTRRKISIGCKGKNLGNQNAKGTAVSEERRAAISARLKGQPRDASIKAKISDGLRAYHASKK